jgi:adenylate cyclase class IV
MLEARGIIQNIEECKKKIENLGGTLKHKYSFTDVIYLPKDKKMDLNAEFIRLRLYKENRWPTKGIILTHKRSHRHEDSKTEVLLIKKEFDHLDEAKAFIGKHYDRKVSPAFKYFRKGWMYQLDNARLYIEDIEKFPFSISIQANSETVISEIFRALNVTKKVNESLPEFMHRILK